MKINSFNLLLIHLLFSISMHAQKGDDSTISLVIQKKSGFEKAVRLFQVAKSPSSYKILENKYMKNVSIFEVALNSKYSNTIPLITYSKYLNLGIQFSFDTNFKYYVFDLNFDKNFKNDKIYKVAQNKIDSAKFNLPLAYPYFYQNKKYRINEILQVIPSFVKQITVTGISKNAYIGYYKFKREYSASFNKETELEIFHNHPIAIYDSLYFEINYERTKIKSDNFFLKIGSVFTYNEALYKIEKIDENLKNLRIKRLSKNIKGEYHMGALEGFYLDSTLFSPLRENGKYDNKYLLLDFWATWCKPCLENRDDIDSLIKKNALGDLKVIGINTEKAQDSIKVKKIINRENIYWNSNFDGDIKKKIINALKIEALPTYILISPKNEIVLRLVGSDKVSVIDDYLNKKLR